MLYKLRTLGMFGIKINLEVEEERTDLERWKVDPAEN
jgi:hypothetical protein